MSLKNTKVLVTGADGFIGSHLVEHLVSAGANVRALSLYNSFNNWGWLDRLDKDVLQSVEVVSGDVRDTDSVDAHTRGCDIVFHLAALIAIPYSYHSPESYVQTNILGTLNVLRASRKHSVTKVIHTSTSEVYGSAEYVPIDEKHPLKGQSPYAATKIGADELALSFYRSFETPVTVLRPFNTFGPRQSARAVIPTIITQIVSGKQTLELGNIETTRDLSYVADTARGFVAAAEAEHTAGQVINIGAGFDVSIRKLVELIAGILNQKVTITQVAERIRPAKSEVHRLLADTRKAEALLRWQRQYQGLDGLTRGLAKTVEFFSDPANLTLYKPRIFNV
jgi:dTDP-glucose 4,6-dehydratase